QTRRRTVRVHAAGCAAPAPNASWTACGVVEAPDVASALRLLHLDRRTKHALEVVGGDEESLTQQ
ncbi:MAG: hypothetical protein L0H31_09590, partial [Nocardioidaceae bacterium]|nr:hypothetical protein [Nocardioidaceae bacterium]